jgi:hypothetical protein
MKNINGRQTGFVIFCVKLPSTTGYGRKDKRWVRSDRKTRKKT